jgi:hypothetical protein
MASSLLTIGLLLAAAPCLAQDVADPGRRLSPEEIKRLDSQTQPAPPSQPVPELKPASRPRDAVACDRARANYQMSCGAPASRKSYSVQCAEANDIYLRTCEGGAEPRISPKSQ